MVARIAYGRMEPPLEFKNKRDCFELPRGAISDQVAGRSGNLLSLKAIGVSPSLFRGHNVLFDRREILQPKADRMFCSAKSAEQNVCVGRRLIQERQMRQGRKSRLIMRIFRLVFLFRAGGVFMDETALFLAVDGLKGAAAPGAVRRFSFRPICIEAV